MKAITISRQFGSGGDQIASQVCEILGYRYFDKQVVAQVAAEVGLSEQAVIDFSEQDYREKRFIDEFGQVIFGARTPSTHAPEQSWGGLQAHLDEDWWCQLVNRAILAAYQQGQVVIVGRGAQMVLQDKPEVLHVRIEAPMESRVKRIQRWERVTVPQALQLAQDYDFASSRYLDRFFKLSWNDPALYHLLINTGKLSIEQAVQLIVGTVHHSI